MNIENIGDFASRVADAYGQFIASLPPMLQNFVNLFLLVLLIVLYSIFVWKLYRFVGTKNIFKFDLNKYNTSSRPFFTKMMAAIFYLIEYIIIVPFLVFFWFAVFTSFLFLLVEGSISVGTILLVSALVIAAVRMCSYIPRYGENLAKELAKILPFTFLAASVLNPTIFSNLVGRVSERFGELSLFFSGIISYLLFIVCLEVVLRFFEFFFNLLGLEEVTEEKEGKNKED